MRYEGYGVAEVFWLYPWLEGLVCTVEMTDSPQDRTRLIEIKKT